MRLQNGLSKIPEMHGESVPLCEEVHPTCEIQHEVCTRFSVEIVAVAVDVAVAAAAAAAVVSVYVTQVLLSVNCNIFSLSFSR